MLMFFRSLVIRICGKNSGIVTYDFTQHVTVVRPWWTFTDQFNGRKITNFDTQVRFYGCYLYLRLIHLCGRTTEICLSFHREDLKDILITDISWYQDKLYLVTNASTVMWFNTTSHEKGLMPNMENVGSLAVDWVGKKIYWSNPKQQLVSVQKRQK